MGYLVRTHYSISPTRYYKDDSCWSADLNSKTTEDIISNRSFMEVLILNHYVLVKKVLIYTASTTDVTEHEITMAQALAALKNTKPNVVVQEQEVSTTIPAVAIIVTTTVPTLRAKGIILNKQKQLYIPIVSSSKDKGKAKLIEPEVLIKKKDQMRMDEEEMRKVNNFIATDLEAQESSTKRTSESLESDISKKQKVDENVDPVIDDTEELKKCMQIVPNDRDEVLFEATPISSRSPIIIDYKIHKKREELFQDH
nr:hypothetical protein [Tanacetum cinerariifolium]